MVAGQYISMMFNNLTSTETDLSVSSLLYKALKLTSWTEDISLKLFRERFYVIFEIIFST